MQAWATAGDLAEDFLSLSDDSPIRFIEAAPENWLKMGGRARKQFDRVAERLPLALHGLSMSLGGQAPLDTALIDGIKNDAPLRLHVFLRPFELLPRRRSSLRFVAAAFH